MLNRKPSFHADDILDFRGAKICYAYKTDNNYELVQCSNMKKIHNN